MHATLPRKFYADPDFYRQELERFYFSRWLGAGRADQIPNPGDYFVRSLAGESVIVTFRPVIFGSISTCARCLRLEGPVFVYH